MKYDVLQVLGMVVMGIAAATGIRQLVDPVAVAWLDWIPGAPLRLLALAAALVIGVALTTWAHGRARALGRR